MYVKNKNFIFIHYYPVVESVFILKLLIVSNLREFYFFDLNHFLKFVRNKILGIINQGKTLFAQLMSNISKYDFEKCVERYKDNNKV